MVTPSASRVEYVGMELPVFALAASWKRYIAHLLQPYIRGEVLEVGAGIGATASALLNPSVTRWVAVEPDSRLAGDIATTARDPSGRITVDVIMGTIESVPVSLSFDTVMYVDVLEHIEDDQRELPVGGGATTSWWPFDRARACVSSCSVSSTER
jgi:2-polyprenyl-3-methyl-5-hydroxy-6-metoxy-1,4-benzoquinol methylase